MGEVYQAVCSECGAVSYKYSTPDLQGSGWSRLRGKWRCYACTAAARAARKMRGKRREVTIQ